ncbi:MAG TPA: hypothetical protein P5287_07130 [bacterium]|nr:hypothetical protein [bacterium]
MKRSNGDARGASVVFLIYAVIVGIIIVLFISTFASEKSGIWQLIIKRYKASFGKEYKEKLRSDTGMMEGEWGKPISDGFTRSEQEAPAAFKQTEEKEVPINQEIPIKSKIPQQ